MPSSVVASAVHPVLVTLQWWVLAFCVGQWLLCVLGWQVYAALRRYHGQLSLALPQWQEQLPQWQQQTAHANQQLGAVVAGSSVLTAGLLPFFFGKWGRGVAQGLSLQGHYATWQRLQRLRQQRAAKPR